MILKRVGWFIVIVLTFTITLPSTAADPNPNRVVFPREKWETITPEKVGLDVEGSNAWVASHSTESIEEYMVAMRDGVTIPTSVRLPSGNGPWPAVLMKGYSVSMGQSVPFVSAGYAYVAQGVRDGSDPHGISGNARFFADDMDGYDTIEWIARQPWCNGKVAMHGGSYGGATQWLAAANGNPGPPPHLEAIIPSVINPDFWDRTYRVQGALNLSMTAISRAFPENQATYENYMYLPLIDMDKAVWGKENVFWNEYITHWYYQSPGLNGQPYWSHIGMRDKYQRIKIPVYIFAGWWDYYAGASLKYYNLLQDLGHTPEVRVWIENTGHSMMSSAESIRWLDWVIKGIDTGMKDEPPVRIFVQGVNQTKYYDQWPPPNVRYVKYYFRSQNGSRIGSLDKQPPDNEPPIHYTYDPNNPCPSIGGNANHRVSNPIELSNGALLAPGSFDQRPVENRDDVLIFSTPILEEDMEVIGPVEIKLYASTDALDTDFTAVLIDVGPDGSAMNVTEGILRARFHKSIWEAPMLLEPGQIYEFTLELIPTARVFLKGHQIRVHLSSSRFPLWDRNTNTGNNPATDAQTKVAHQTIYHDQNYPSHIILPIITSGADLKGDLNLDGAIDELDVQLCIHVILGIERDSDIINRADVNEDGNVDVLDVQDIVNRGWDF